MKRIYAILAFAGLCFLANPVFGAAVSAAATAPPSNIEASALEVAKSAKTDWDNMSRKEKRQEMKQKKSEIKNAIKDWKAAGSDTNVLLLVIIAILLPPLAMAIYDGITKRFWISLLLTLLFYLPGLIYTLYIILSEK